MAIDASSPVVWPVDSPARPISEFWTFSMLSRLITKPVLSDETLTMITMMYADECAATRVNFRIATAQMIHETANVTSNWSVYHKNMAGIGVTGAPGVGLTFPTWSAGIRAHVGRLSLYGAAQPSNIYDDHLRAEARAVRFLPDTQVGQGKTLGTMAKLWAADTNYVKEVAAIANALYK